MLDSQVATLLRYRLRAPLCFNPVLRIEAIITRHKNFISTRIHTYFTGNYYVYFILIQQQISNNKECVTQYISFYLITKPVKTIANNGKVKYLIFNKTCYNTRYALLPLITLFL